MTDYKCTKCGAIASSKCVRQRSVFLVDEIAAMIRNTIQITANRVLPKTESEAKHNDSDVWDVNITVRRFGYNTDEEAIAAAIRMFRAYDDAKWKQIPCDHAWKIEKGECMFGCCKAHTPEEQPA